ncbi:MAG: tetratricopeptide repeat protein [Bacteroidota bacterium]
MKKQLCVKYLSLLFLMLQCFFLTAQNRQTIDSLQNIIKSTQNDTVKISSLIQISNQYRDFNSDKAFEFGLEALTFSIKLNYSQFIGKAHNNLGDLYWYEADYSSSSDHYFKALKIYEGLKDKPAIADCYRNIGWIYSQQQKNNDEALRYYSKALVINQELNAKKGIGQNYNDIGLIYTQQKKYEEAIMSFRKAFEMHEDAGNKEGMAATYSNLSAVYDKMGNLNLVIENYEKSIKISEEIGNKRYLSDSYSYLAEVYTKANRYNEAGISLQKALVYAKEINDKNIIKSIYIKFSKLFEKKGDFLKALEYISYSSKLTDSIFDENNARQVNEMTAKYESKKKELTIDSLKKDNALSEEKLQREKKFKIYLIIFCFLIAAFVFVMFRANIQKRKANFKLSLAYEEIEVKNKDITDSINYSKRIQDASLSPKELKYKLFPDCFVLFKPKDIVSGDFYWYAEKNGKRLIASCDCTGHGVPGALMSMIGNNILNRIVNEKGVTSPDEILNRLHKEIRKALNQEEQSGTKDGMDIALVVFNNETEIEYAGAHRPLWIIKNGDNSELVIDNDASQQVITKNQQLIEEKADKFSIGGAQSEIERKFTNHKISLSKGDSIYIFSDGFVDQFGGTKGKKFMSKRFKDLLLVSCGQSMVEQEKNLRKALESWKGSREQVDDILVIGIKI